MSGLLARRRAGGVPETGARPAADRVTVATRIAAVAVVLGLIGVAVFGGLWFLNTHGPAAKTAMGRDDALAAARQIAVNLQTLDYGTVDKGLDTWEASATGPLLDELKKNRTQYADQIRQLQVSTTGRLVDAALSDLDISAGKATALAAVDVSVTQMVNGAPSLPYIKQVRLQIELVRTPDAGWKADASGAIRS